MTFTILMRLIAFTAPMAFWTPLICGGVEGWYAPERFGIWIGLLVGSGSGVVSFLGVRCLSRWGVRHPKLSAPHPGASWIGVAWLLCAGLFAWVICFNFVGLWLTKFVIHAVAA